MIHKKKHDKQKVRIWRERFCKVLEQLANKNDRFSESEVAEDIIKAVSEVRYSSKKLER